MSGWLWGPMLAHIDVSEAEAPEVAAIFEMYGSAAIGSLPCPGRAPVPEEWNVSMHEFATALGHSCPDCKAVV